MFLYLDSKQAKPECFPSACDCAGKAGWGFFFYLLVYSFGVLRGELPYEKGIEEIICVCFRKRYWKRYWKRFQNLQTHYIQPN